jgi:hypothetical protein
MRLLPLGAAAAVVAVAIGVAALGHPSSAPAARPSPRPSTQLWAGTAALLQTPGHGLLLCGGGTLDSLPPAGCGGAIVHGLDPMTVPGAHRFPNGTITAPSVRLVGTWDGTALTVTEPPELSQPSPGPTVDIPGPSCPEPPGGWPYDRVDLQRIQRVQAYLATQPDAGTLRVDNSQRIFTAPFTGDLERHRADIARLYDGPICVEAVQRSDRELRAVGTRAQAELKARGLQLLNGNSGGSAFPYDELTVVAVTAREKAEIEAEYGGALRLTSFLQPT